MREIYKAAAIFIKNDEFLMVRKVGKKTWTNLGGHLEKDETEEEALLREIKEEIGCEATIIKKLGDFVAPAAHDNANVKLATFLVEIHGNMIISDPELAEFRFIPQNFKEMGLKMPESIEKQVIPFLINNNYLQWS